MLLSSIAIKTEVILEIFKSENNINYILQKDTSGDFWRWKIHHVLKNNLSYEKGRGIKELLVKSNKKCFLWRPLLVYGHNAVKPQNRFSLTCSLGVDDVSTFKIYWNTRAKLLINFNEYTICSNK